MTVDTTSSGSATGGKNQCPKCGLVFDDRFPFCPVCNDPPAAGLTAKSPARPRARLRYLQKTAVKELVNKLGKRCGDDFLLALDDLVRSRVVSASKVHNGGRKTMDAVCLGGVASRK